LKTNVTLSGELWEAFAYNPEQVATLIANMQDGFAYCKIITDQNQKPIDYVYIDVNKAFEELFNLKKENIVGKKATEVFTSSIADSPANWVNIFSSKLSEKPTIIERYSQTTKKWYQYSIYSPKHGYFVSIFEDITERKKIDDITEENEFLRNALDQCTEQVEKMAQERINQLKEAEWLAAVGQTAGIVGHDIRNPLQSIVGEVFLASNDLESLPESEAKKNIAESLDLIRKNSEYINKIVSDLQDYAKPLNSNTKEINLEDIVNDALKERISNDIKAIIRIEDNAKTATVEPTYMKRILGNLILNAVQAMPNGGTLTIHAFQEENSLVVTVEDTGEGIPENVKTNLFKPLFTTKSKGQGFGLAVCKRLVEALGGTITFQSTPGKGTKFTVRIPNTTKGHALQYT
jgi:signal transduction histidine kinase